MLLSVDDPIRNVAEGHCGSRYPPAALLIASCTRAALAGEQQAKQTDDLSDDDNMDYSTAIRINSKHWLSLQLCLTWQSFKQGETRSETVKELGAKQPFLSFLKFKTTKNRSQQNTAVSINLLSS